MMDFQEVINKRRSIRAYKSKTVPENILKKIIKNASLAPSACNRQPWKFYLVTNKNKLDKIKLELKKNYSKQVGRINKTKSLESQKNLFNFYETLWNAPHIVFVYIPKHNDSVTETYDIMSVSCATENLCLSASNEGLGSCISGSFKFIEKEINAILNVPKDMTLVFGITLGYPDNKFQPNKITRKSLNEILKII